MSINPSRPTRKADRTAAVNIEVPPGVADDIEGILRDFAEEAELDTSLVVDHSGFLIAGISSLPDVDVDTIGELVAGASGATEGLTGALGEAGQVESLHLGEDRLLYLKDVGERFILVGVSDSNIPAGILRDQASRIEESLRKQLAKVKAVPVSLTKKKATQPAKMEQPQMPNRETPKSLRPEPKPEPAPVPVKASVKEIAASTSREVPPERPAPPRKDDAIPDSVFEVEEEKNGEKPAFAEEIPSKQANSRPAAIVENSPFEMDDEDDGSESTFKTARPNTTPVHLAVPAARQRHAEQKQEDEEDDDRKSGPRYSFELG